MNHSEGEQGNPQNESTHSSDAHALSRRGFLKRAATSSALALGGALIPGITFARSPTTEIPDLRAINSINPIVAENRLPGTNAWQLKRDDFKVNDKSEEQIMGYASATSVNKGESLTLYVTVNPHGQRYTIDFYRVGWYGGTGGRHMEQVGPLRGVSQTEISFDPETGLNECRWTPSYTFRVPETWTSGIYLALLTNEQKYQSYIVFVVRDDARQADLLYQQSVTTYQAYNYYPNDRATGKSIYDHASYGEPTLTGAPRAVKVSFDRPYVKGNGTGDFFRWEILFVRWMERMGYDVSYSTDLDTHRNGQRLQNYRGFLVVGHDEYWSKEMYTAAEAARDKGVHLAFFGANNIYWQMRMQASTAGQTDRIMVCYKDAELDPETNTHVKTVRWRDDPVEYPEQRLIGVQYRSYFSGPDFPFVASNSDHWVYANTGFSDGDSVPGIVGYEVDNFSKSIGLPAQVPGSHTLVSHSPYLDYKGRTRYGNSSIYQALSGAWVFGGGTMSWSRGLDNLGEYQFADPRFQQLTANILNAFVPVPRVMPSDGVRVFLPLITR